MTKITITKINYNIVKIEVEGHADYEEAGKDIVCAAISALGQYLIIGLEDIVGLDEVSIINQNGCIKLDISNIGFLKFDYETSNIVQAMFKTFALSVIGIQSEYPNNVKVVEVKEC